ncbi:hypothetical protein D3C73_1277240 [compost metagenome]
MQAAAGGRGTPGDPGTGCDREQGADEQPHPSAGPKALQRIAVGHRVHGSGANGRAQYAEYQVAGQGDGAACKHGAPRYP